MSMGENHNPQAVVPFRPQDDKTWMIASLRFENFGHTSSASEVKKAPQSLIIITDFDAKVEEPVPEERVEVQIQDQAVAVECQRLGGYGREGRTPATACGKQTAGCRERLPEEATAR